MQQDDSVQDPFNWSYFFAILAVLVTIPLMHVILGWMVYFF